MGYPFKITVSGDQCQVALQSRGCHQGVHVSDQPRAVRWPQRPSDVGVTLQDGVSHEKRCDLCQQLTELALMKRKVGPTLEMFDHFPVGEDAGRCLVLIDPWVEQIYGRRSVVEVRPQGSWYRPDNASQINGRCGCRLVADAFQFLERFVPVHVPGAR